MSDHPNALKEIGAEIILTALRDAQWLTEESPSKRKIDHLLDGTPDPIGELQDFCEDGRLTDIVDFFGLTIDSAIISDRIQTLLRRARIVRAKHPLKPKKSRGVYKTPMWEKRQVAPKLPEAERDRKHTPTPSGVNLYSVSRLASFPIYLFPMDIYSVSGLRESKRRGPVASQRPSMPVGIIKFTQLEFSL